MNMELYDIQKNGKPKTRSCGPSSQAAAKKSKPNITKPCWYAHKKGLGRYTEILFLLQSYNNEVLNYRKWN